MPLSVIGAGFGRTGTESMKLALEMLGLGPCHHMHEVHANPDQKAIWRRIALREFSDWEVAFAGYRSSVDWPSAFYWRELADAYPEARILLTVRSTESWLTSMENTILPALRNSADPDSVGVKVVAERVFGGVLDDPAHTIATYERNTAEVQAAIPAERLLTYHLGDGWEPLCRFLDKPIPDVPYPRSNSTEQFNAKFSDMNKD